MDGYASENLANGTPFDPLYGCFSDYTACQCEISKFCLNCSLNFQGLNLVWSIRQEQNCRKWLDSLSYERTGSAEIEEGTYDWNGDVAFRPVDSMNGDQGHDGLTLMDYDVSFMDLADTPDPVAPDNDIPLLVSPWTGKLERAIGRYHRQGHLMVDCEGLQWIRLFPLTGHHIVCAKAITKVQRFGMPQETYKQDHLGWEEFLS